MAAGHPQHLAWVGVLQAAEEWGCPPWEIERGPAIWYARYREYSKAREKARG